MHTLCPTAFDTPQNYFGRMFWKAVILDEARLLHDVKSVLCYFLPPDTLGFFLYQSLILLPHRNFFASLASSYTSTPKPTYLPHSLVLGPICLPHARRIVQRTLRAESGRQGPRQARFRRRVRLFPCSAKRWGSGSGLSLQRSCA